MVNSMLKISFVDIKPNPAFCNAYKLHLLLFIIQRIPEKHGRIGDITRLQLPAGD